MIIQCLKESAVYTALIILVIVLAQMILSILIKLFVYILKIALKVTIGISDKKATKIVWWIVNRLTFVGTMHHELSHAIFAFVFGAKILKVDLFKPHGDTLGQVWFMPQGSTSKKALQKSMISLAPTLTGVINSIILIYLALDPRTFIAVRVLLWYIIISILLHSTMSKQDIKNASKGFVLSFVVITASIFAVNVIYTLGVYL